MIGGVDGVLVRTDPRSRVSLARLGVDAGQIFQASVEDDGTVRLVPILIVPASEVQR